MIFAIIQSSILIALALIAVCVLHRQSSATRHAVLAIGLISAVVGPIIGRWTPIFPIKVVYHSAYESTDLTPLNSSAIASVSSVTPARPSFDWHVLRWIWLAGLIAACGTMVVGIMRVLAFVRRGVPIRDVRWDSMKRELCRSFHLRRQIVFVRTRSSVLGTWGFLRPILLLPIDCADWPDERLRAVLTHEFAHIKRFDWPIQLLAELARAVYWFNPLFWLACRWLRSESEHACDDVVLNAGMNPHDYAVHLLDLARTLKDSNDRWTPVLAMSRPPHLERRFLAMLNPSLNHQSISRATVLIACGLAICVALPLAGMRTPERPVQVSARPPKTEQQAPSATQTRATAVVAAAVSKPLPRKSAAPQGRADGILSGRISDGTGAFLPGVKVTVSATAGGAWETTADEVGAYQFNALREGQYLMMAELPGFMTATRRVQIQPSQTSRQNITLNIGAIAERITVSADGRPKPIAVPAGPQRVRIGGNVQAARLLSQVRPIYPENARAAGIEGVVVLQGLIGSDGTLIGLRVLSSNDPDLSAAAIEAVKQWRYRPTLLNNVPVEVVTDISADFKLNQ